MFGKEENIKNNKKIFKDNISKLMSGKSHSDENFPVASFLMKKILEISCEHFITLQGWLTILQIIKIYHQIKKCKY